MFAYLLKLSFLLLLLLFSSYSSKITRLYSDNFEDNVFFDNDPWIIGIENKINFHGLERIYEQVKDRIKVGVIEPQELSSYLREQVTLQLFATCYASAILFNYQIILCKDFLFYSLIFK